VSFVFGRPRSTRQTVDDQRVIRVHALHRVGAFRNGMVTTWTWPPDLVVTVRARDACAEFTFGDQTAVVRVVSLPGTLGGAWSTFECPRCDRRTWNLYLRAGALACRRCHRLTYASKLEHIPAAMLRARALRRRLGAENLQPFTALPPRASRRGRAALKYDRLAAEIARCEGAVLGLLSDLSTIVERQAKRTRR
jgi:hypothetical protein